MSWVTRTMQEAITAIITISILIFRKVLPLSASQRLQPARCSRPRWLQTATKSTTSMECNKYSPAQWLARAKCQQATCTNRSTKWKQTRATLPDDLWSPSPVARALASLLSRLARRACSWVGWARVPATWTTRFALSLTSNRSSQRVVSTTTNCNWAATKPSDTIPTDW